MSDSTSPNHRQIALFATTFDPPGRYHRAAAEALIEHGVTEVVVWPTGHQPGRGESEHAASHHRAALADLAFQDLARVWIDLTDLENGTYLPPAERERRYAGSGEVWHAISADLVKRDRDGRPALFARWEGGEQLWQAARFLVLHQAGMPPNTADLPPRHRLIPVDAPHRPSAELRTRIFTNESVDEFLDPKVSTYLSRNRLYIPGAADRTARLLVNKPKLMVVYDERNPRACEVAKKYLPMTGDPPDLIAVIGGDGTMLHAIRKHWRLRVPFLGINTGHLGFLMNERLPDELDGLDLVTRSQPMLQVDAELPDGQVTRGLAYGDAWLERAEGQAAWIQLDVDGQTQVPKVVGDGLLVATAAGSSAYARAMGAVPVPLNTRVLTLVGSNVFHPRFWKPMALNESVVIRLTNLDRLGKRPLRGYIDGLSLGIVQSMTLRRSAVASVELAFTREFDPSAKLLRSLFPPTEDQ